jgi:hypothetical protein
LENLIVSVRTSPPPANRRDVAVPIGGVTGTVAAERNGAKKKTCRNVFGR